MLFRSVRVILGELRKLVEEPPSEEEMSKVRDYSVGNFRLGLETPMALGQRAGELLLTMGEIEPIDSVVEKLRSITGEDILRVARRIIDSAKLVLAVVGPGLEEEELEAVMGDGAW